MSTHEIARNWLLVLGAMLALALSSPARAAEETRTVTAPPSKLLVLDSAKCIVQTGQIPGTDIVTDSTGTKHLLYQAPATLPAPLTITAQFGSADQAPGCAEPTTRHYVVSIDDNTSTIPPEALGQAFRILVAAFVLAVLLESAFELLFNWRLFQEYFVGKAWRTPIMFAISLAVVDQFGFDPLARLFTA